MRKYATYLCAALIVAALTMCGSGPDPQPESKERITVEVVDYHDNGMVSKRGITIDGQRHGLWESFYPNGLKWSETTFRNGVKQGPTVTYFPNGMMRYSGSYYDDERSGMWVLYDTSGTIYARIDMDLDPTRGDSLMKASISAQ